MAKGSGGTRSGSASNPRGVGSTSSFSSTGDYYRTGASDRLAKKMSSPSKMEAEINKYTDTVGKTLGVDTSRGDWTYNDAVLRNVFGNGFSYANERLQNEGIRQAISKAVNSMSERERAAFVLADTNHDRSVYSGNLNQKDGTRRTPFGPYDDDVAATALMGKTKAQRTELFAQWRKNLETMTFDGAFYSRRGR